MNQARRRLMKILIFLCALIFVESQPADPNANEKTKQLLNFIVNVPKQGKFISGQFAGYNPDTFNMNQIQETNETTGKVPALLSCDWSCGWDMKNPPENIINFTCNDVLKQHWNSNGLVTINMHLPNPSWPQGGGFNNKTYLNFGDLLMPNTETGKRWRAYLDRMALGLADLQDAGVSVLFRPFHEMNGNWFWWCDQDSDTFKHVWMDMFNYLVNTKNLHNILWVYSPDHSRLGLLKFYPGDSFVDIVGLDAYTDDPHIIHGYDEITILKKPFALSEVGPKTKFGQYDYLRLIDAIESKFKKVSYVLSWNDKWAPISNLNAVAYFNHPRTLNMGDIHF